MTSEPLQFLFDLSYINCEQMSTCQSLLSPFTLIATFVSTLDQGSQWEMGHGDWNVLLFLMGRQKHIGKEDQFIMYY